MVVGIVISLTNFVVGGAFLLFGVIKLLLELSSKSTIQFNNDGFVFDGYNFFYEDVKLVMVRSEMNNVNRSLLVGGGGVRWKKTCIVVEDLSSKHQFGKKMILDYQKALVHIIKQFQKGNTTFTQRHFKVSMQEQKEAVALV